MPVVQKKTVLITGCSAGGIGWHLANAFLKRDFYVFATARDTSKVEGLAELSNVEVLQLDVTDQDSILRCKDTVAQRTGGRLDVLINNAAAEFVCPVLDVDIAESKKLYDVNVWGPLAMVQAFAPLVIEAQGVISNHTSIACVIPIVWSAVYSSSKAALWRMSEIMRLELEPLGVRVVTAMCGSVDTPMFSRPGGRMKLPETSYYYDVQDTAYQERMAHQRASMRPDAFAEQIVKDILGGAKGQIWRGVYAGLVRVGSQLFPQWYLDKSCNVGKGLEKVKRRSQK
ncbi:b155a884-83ad-4558-8b15-cbe33b9ca34f [Thermothielavioides terrestris]|uniref:B155a884-83ad-4558-8b15-cbe33b9ca34f n=1 Tax=Thermothielavioides terrestris TaxID=2587410 RepID=A0A446BGG6_9PEZI|nr:b155a884-83ad-4558-8b15-cbe33b9ca34f [Thermothielavioides terrestris]